MLPKLGFSLEMKYDRPMEQVIGLIGDAGFTALSPLWEQDLSVIAECARVNNMALQSLHAPPKGMAQLWHPDTPAPLQQDMHACLDACVRFEIPTLVVHGWQGQGYTFPDTPLDFTFWDGFVRHAEEAGVAIAFENLEGEEYLAALMERYCLPHIGFCWDSGHDRCYPHTIDFLQAFGNRLIMTHLNDNFGVTGDSYTSKDDRHLIPFDGNTDWCTHLGRLACAPMQDTLNFELKTLSHGILTYPQWTLEQFIIAAAERAHRIATLYETIMAQKA